MLDTSSSRPASLEVKNVSQHYHTGSGEQRRAGSRPCLALPEGRRDRRPARPLRLRQVLACCASSPGWSAGLRRRQLSRRSRSTGPSTASPWCSRASRCFPGSRCKPMSSLACAPAKCPRRKRASRALKAIDLIGLDGFESAFPKELSGRHAPARRLRPRARRPSQHPSDGRAVLGARRAHRRDVAHRSSRPLGRGPHADQVDFDGDPQHRGGGADVRPHHRPLVESRPHRRRNHRHAAASAQSPRSRIPPARRSNLRADDAAAPEPARPAGRAPSRASASPWRCRRFRPIRWPA